MTMAARSRASLLPAMLVASVAAALLYSSASTFIPAANRSAGRPVAVAGFMGAALAPLAAMADLPPLEDLEMNELNPNPVRSTNMEFMSFDENNAAMYGVVIVGAIVWALTIVSFLRPAKDEEGVYKTYIGGGALPPEGYTNPLDPRMNVDDEEEDAYETAKQLRKQDRQRAKAQKASTSAVV
mmetsp:Transcript_35825/g.82235  ORF Transcript_35825/g.82235 Transcript_35825/m.82235 type:complete len:183 (-) Transcript_35825:139-687(-)